MVYKTVKIIKPTGLHMRPPGHVASTMGKFSSTVTIKGNGKEINGKSPMAIMAGGLGAGTEIEIVCDGADEEEALKAAVDLVESGLGE